MSDENTAPEVAETEVAATPAEEVVAAPEVPETPETTTE
jgi:hypothetical protein